MKENSLWETARFHDREAYIAGRVILSFEGNLPMKHMAKKGFIYIPVNSKNAQFLVVFEI